jgi:hypothetical protein
MVKTEKLKSDLQEIHVCMASQYNSEKNKKEGTQKKKKKLNTKP